MGNPWDGYLLGPENALAHASALALACGEPGLSPLVIHGPSGVGKSRLLAALRAEWLARRPHAAAAHLTAENFAADCALADAHEGGWNKLRERFRTVDMLVLEDVYRLEHATMTLNELEHTLDALEATGAAVAVSAAIAPALWVNWPDRLVSRFTAGLAVRIDSPGPETRRRYVLEHARRQGLTLSGDALESVVQAADGYRALHGLLVRLRLIARLDRKPIDGRTVSSILDVAEQNVESLSVELIAKAVAAQFHIRLRDLRSPSRRANLVLPRHLAMYLARQHSGRSFSAIGKYFGGRDPASIRHACRMAAIRIEAEPALAALTAALVQPLVLIDPKLRS
jgi:chromosomal replication initiator protein